MKIDVFFKSAGCVHCEVQRGLWGGGGTTAGGVPVAWHDCVDPVQMELARALNVRSVPTTILWRAAGGVGSVEGLSEAKRWTAAVSEAVVDRAAAELAEEG